MQIIRVTPFEFLMSYICAFCHYIEVKYVTGVPISKRVSCEGCVTRSDLICGVSIISIKYGDIKHVLVYAGENIVSTDRVYKGVPSKPLSPVVTVNWQADFLTHGIEVYSSGIVKYNTELWEIVYDNNMIAQ